MWIVSLIHRSILLLSQSITSARSQSVMWLRDGVVCDCWLLLLLRICWCFVCKPLHHIVRLPVSVPKDVHQKLCLFLQCKFCHGFYLVFYTHTSRLLYLWLLAVRHSYTRRTVVLTKAAAVAEMSTKTTIIKGCNLMNLIYLIKLQHLTYNQVLQWQKFGCGVIFSWIYQWKNF